MDTNVPAGAGTRRPPPYAAEPDPRPGQKPRLDPDAIAQSLASSLRHVSLPSCPSVAALFQTIAQAQAGEPADLDEAVATEAFNELIAGHDYQAFTEAFALYSEIGRARAFGSGEPYTSRLVLRLGPEWVSQDKPAMLQAFGQTKITQLVVVTWPTHTAGPVPEDVCDGIRVLLEAGTTELAIAAPLARPKAVAHALAGSALRAFAFLWAGLTDGPVPYAERQAYNKAQASDKDRLASHVQLLDGLCQCRTLEHLTVGDPVVVQMHAMLAKFHHPGGPKLKTVELYGSPSMHRCEGLVPFTGVVKDFSTLATFKATLAVRTHANLKAMVLDPFRGHPCLAALTVQDGQAELDIDQDNLAILPQVILFAASCPALQSFALRYGNMDVTGGALEALRVAGGKLQDRSDLEAMARALADPMLALRALWLEGLTFTRAAAATFFRGLARNVSLRELHCSQSFFDLQSVVEDLMDALRSNRTLEKLELEKETAFYYWMTPDGKLEGFASDPSLQFSLEPRNAPQQAMAGSPDPLEQSFAPLKEKAATLAEDLRARLARNLRESSGQAAPGAPAPDAKAGKAKVLAMKTWLPANVLKGIDLWHQDSFEESDSPNHSFSAEGSERSDRQAVVRPKTTRPQFEESRLDPSSRGLLDAALAAIAHQENGVGRPDVHRLFQLVGAGLKVQVVNREGANLLLLAAAAANSLEAVQLLLASGARDDSRRALGAAWSPAVAAALRVQDLEAPGPVVLPPPVRHGSPLDRALEIIQGGLPAHELWSLHARGELVWNVYFPGGGNAFLMTAARSGHLEILSGLLARGVQDVGRCAEAVASSPAATAILRAALPRTTTASTTSTTTTSSTVPGMTTTTRSTAAARVPDGLGEDDGLG